MKKQSYEINLSDLSLDGENSTKDVNTTSTTESLRLKREAVVSRLAKRDAARKNNIATRREALAQERDPEQNPTVFWNYLKLQREIFQKKLKEINENDVNVPQSVSDSNAATTSSLTTCQTLVSDLESKLAQASLFLPKFDIERTRRIILEMKQQIETQRNVQAPKSRFSFKSKKKKKKEKKEKKSKKKSKKKVAKTTNTTGGSEGQSEGVTEETRAKNDVSSSETTSQSSSALDGQSNSEPTTTGSILSEASLLTSDQQFCSKSKAFFMPPKEAYESQNPVVYLSQLEDCVVVLPGVAGALHCSHLKNCLVISGPIAGSCLLENLENCTLVLGVRQVRIHHAISCYFSLHCASRPIIEYCEKLVFGPYLVTYKNLQKQIKSSQVPWTEKTIENWRDVDDFRWLRKHVPSPHWRAVENDEAGQLEGSNRLDGCFMNLLKDNASLMNSFDLHLFGKTF
eukprot:g1202.t1